MQALLGLITGFGLYHLIKKSKISGLEKDEAQGVFDPLLNLRNKLIRATKQYRQSENRIANYDIQLSMLNDQYVQAENEQRPDVFWRIAMVQRARDAAALEAALILRNVLTPLRERMITEEARLRSALVTPEVAIRRQNLN